MQLFEKASVREFSFDREGRIHVRLVTLFVFRLFGHRVDIFTDQENPGAPRDGDTDDVIDVTDETTILNAAA